MTETPRDHGGGLDAAIATYGGTRARWIDLSTGINPHPYPVGNFDADTWGALPDRSAHDALVNAARKFWNVPKEADILAAPGASALIAQIPTLAPHGDVFIQTPTYNEHAAAFAHHGWNVTQNRAAGTQVAVHPNNPDGYFWPAGELTAQMRIIDESFCDIAPDSSHIEMARTSRTLVLKSFGKFWGLAGLRLGFAIGDPEMIAALRARMGPWAVSGPALVVGAKALGDITWAAETRARLSHESTRLDALMQRSGGAIVGGTSLFRLYRVDDAAAFQSQLAQHHIWSRIFPYSTNWLRLGLPHADHWDRLESALL